MSVLNYFNSLKTLAPLLCCPSSSWLMESCHANQGQPPFGNTGWQDWIDKNARWLAGWWAGWLDCSVLWHLAVIRISDLSYMCSRSLLLQMPCTGDSFMHYVSTCDVHYHHRLLCPRLMFRMEWAAHNAAHSNSSSQCTKQMRSCQRRKGMCLGTEKICNQMNKFLTKKEKACTYIPINFLPKMKKPALIAIRPR